MEQGLRNYFIVTGSYWAFTITDGALRMLVVLYFHLLGYSPLQVAMLFLFYEFFGIVTNLVGGWLGSRIGLNITMHIGMGLQILALSMLMAPENWLSVAYVMLAQAISGIAKDLNKMSAKASVKTLLPENSDSSLFRWIAILTGSKNALKGLGFFVGALLLQTLTFRGALIVLAIGLVIALLTSILLLPGGLGKTRHKAKFKHVFSNSPAINWLSAARFFLFGARDIWFVVALPLFLYTRFQWDFMQVGAFLAFWIIGYGIVQSIVPRFLYGQQQGRVPCARAAMLWAITLAMIPAIIALGLYYDMLLKSLIIAGLVAFAIVFAINSVIHSYLIIALSDHDKVSMNVGFYYMANAAGRLVGTVLSGWIYQYQGLVGCLIGSSIFVILAAIMSSGLVISQRTVKQTMS